MDQTSTPIIIAWSAVVGDEMVAAFNIDCVLMEGEKLRNREKLRWMFYYVSENVLAVS